MKYRHNKIRLRIDDEELQERIYDAKLGAREFGSTLKKLKRKLL